MDQNIILSLRNISKSYPIYSPYLRRVIGSKKILENINLELKRNSTLGILGSSGSGKTTIAKIIVGIEKADTGEVFYEKENLLKMKSVERAKKVQLVFQNAYAVLNPKFKVGFLIKERIRHYFKINSIKFCSSDVDKKTEYFLDVVKLSNEILNKFPYQLSGGQRQRIAILLAIILMPKILILDEPLSSLDVSLQAQILNFLNEVKKVFNFTFIFITHDLNVAKYFCDELVLVENLNLTYL